MAKVICLLRQILQKYNPNYKFKEIERGEKVLFAWDEKSELEVKRE